MESYMPTPIDILKQDLVQQLEESMGDLAEEMAAELAPIYLEDAPGQVESMKASLLSGNAFQLREAAHALKGSSANMGFKQMVKLSLEIEIMAKKGLPDPQAGKNHFNLVIQEMRQIVEMIQTYYQ